MINYFQLKKREFVPNVFASLRRSKLEDRFTRSWEYLLNANKELGQSIVDYIAKSCGRLESSVFLEAIDQSRFSFNHKTNRQPDLVLLCEKYCIVCEHKITSRQGDKQLETYLQFKHKNKPLYVTYISNRTDEILDESILLSENYLKPENSEYHYYRWEEFFPIVKRHTGYLIKEFAMFMKSLSMEKITIDGWGDIFNDEKEREKFKVALEPSKFFLAADTGGDQHPDPKLGFHIRVFKVMRTQVLRLFADKSDDHLDLELDGPGLFLQVKRHTENRSQVKNLREINDEIDTTLGLISARTIKDSKPDGNKLIIMREYSIGLDKILAQDMSETQKKIKAFAHECTKHLRTSDRNLFQIPK
jgi:hypothetical protein